MSWIWGIGAIVVIATIYEINPKVGLGLAVLAVMGMLLTYQTKYGFKSGQSPERKAQ